jgi:hypothetical protein
MAEYIDRSDVLNPQTMIALKGDVWSVLTLDALNRLMTVIATPKGQLENAELDSQNRLKTVIATAKGQLENAELDSQNRLKTVIATAKGQLENAELDSQNRLKVVPTKFTDFYSNFNTIHMGESARYTAHEWTTRISGTVPAGHLYVIQTVYFGFSIPSSGALLGIRLLVNGYDVITVTGGSGSTDANRQYNFVLHFVMKEGETFEIKTLSNDSVARYFAYYIHILDFTIA